MARVDIGQFRPTRSQSVVLLNSSVLVFWFAWLAGRGNERGKRGGEIDYSAVAQAVRRLTRRIQENAGLDRAFRILQKEIAQMSKSRSDPILHPSLWNKRRLNGSAPLVQPGRTEFSSRRSV